MKMKPVLAFFTFVWIRMSALGLYDSRNGINDLSITMSLSMNRIGRVSAAAVSNSCAKNLAL